MATTLPYEDNAARRVSVRAARAHAQKWGLLYFAIAGMFWTYVWRAQQIFPALSWIVMPISLCAIALFALRNDAISRLRQLDHPIFKFAALILAWMVLSVPDGVFPGHAARFIYQDHIKTFVFFVLIAASIRGMKDVERFAVVHILGAVLFGGMSLVIGGVDNAGRLSGIGYYDPNDLCMLMVCTLPMVLYFIVRKKGALARLGCVAALALFSIVIIRTGSRGGFLGLLTVAAYLLFQFRALKPAIRWSVVTVAAVGFMAVAGDDYWESMRTILNPKADYNWAGNSEAGRMEIWKRGAGYMVQNPIVGVGAASFFAAEGTSELARERELLGLGTKWSVSHNAYVQIGAELGFPGLIFFLLMFWHAFRGTREIGLNRRGTDEGAFGQVMSAAMLGIAICSVFLSAAYSPYLYATLGIIVGFIRVARTADPQPQHTPRRGRRSPPYHQPVMREPAWPVSLGSR